MGIWFRMCADNLKDRYSYWTGSIATAKWFRDAMSWESFKRIHQYSPTAPQKVEEVGEGEDKFQWFERWLHACNKQFRTTWEQGTHLTVDETMLFWTGLGPVHLTYIPRKPSPLGIMFKVLRVGYYSMPKS